MNRTTRLVRRAVGGIARGIAAALSLALLVATGYGWSLHRELGNRVVTSNVIDAAAPTLQADQPFTALLVGLDSRTDAAGNPLPPSCWRSCGPGRTRASSTPTR